MGAKRDPAWGPALLLGLGGIWVKALGGVRLVPANVTEATGSRNCRNCVPRNC